MPTPGPLEFLIIALILAMFLVPIVLVIALVRRRPALRAESTPDPALATLRDRFAAGDIDEAEYERLRSVLQRG